MSVRGSNATRFSRLALLTSILVSVHIQSKPRRYVAGFEFADHRTSAESKVCLCRLPDSHLGRSQTGGHCHVRSTFITRTSFLDEICRLVAQTRLTPPKN
jgi:hypothetical protein